MAKTSLIFIPFVALAVACGTEPDGDFSDDPYGPAPVDVEKLTGEDFDPHYDMCDGAVPNCPSFNNEDGCQQIQGCFWVKELSCTGAVPSKPCHAHPNFMICQLAGCTWWSTDNGSYCEGTPADCSKITSFACEDVGCETPAGICRGDALKCWAVGLAQCEEQPGCAVVPSCGVAEGYK